MKKQVTVRIPDELDRALDLASRRLQMTPSEVVRKALAQFLQRVDPDVRPADRVGSLIGSLESGVPDLADNHRQHILDSLRDAR